MSEERRELFKAPGRLDLGIGAGLFVVALGLLLATMDIGFTRDESFYFHAARDYWGWFAELGQNWDAGGWAWLKSFKRESVDRHWGYNPEHPALMKTLFALSWALFYKKLGWLAESTAIRLPTAVMSAWLVSMVYLFTRQLGGRVAGVIAAAALLLQPHYFFHSHMACFDVPVVALWFAVVYAYWRGFASRGWAVATGALWGLCLTAKLNAFFLPIVLVGHWLLSQRRAVGVERGPEGPTLRLPPLPWAFVAMALLGPLIFYLHWPRIWFDTFERVRWYMNFHLTHVHYFVQFRGQSLYAPPFPVTLPSFLTLVTVPPTILLAGVFGVWSWWSERGMLERVSGLFGKRFGSGATYDERGTGMLLLVNFVFPILLISMPSTPVFGGTKHWMPAMPFLAMMSGLGVVWAARRLRLPQVVAERGVAALLGLALMLPAGLACARHYQYGISYYNELIGGIRGAADAGMARQFWGYASRGALPWLNANAPERAKIWTHDTTGWAFDDYKREGLVRQDLIPWGMGGSDLGMLDEDKAFYFERYDLWEQYGTRAPIYVLTHEGVPLVSVYRRER
jgi:4-amino-4-deoxy-L-arabinose transferase-like glycosyltransferase